MDPLSLAASISGLVSFADTVFTRVHKYIRAAKGAKQEIQALSDEINWLAATLRSLGALASELEAEGDVFDPSLLVHLVGHCRQTLDKIETKVQTAADGIFAPSRSKVVGATLKWPFSVSETKTLLAEVSRHKATMTSALSADTMRKLQLCLTKVDKNGQHIVAIAKDIRDIKINTQIAMDSRKRRVLDFFMKTSPQPSFETSIKLRHPMTGLWLTESARFNLWLETPGSKMWLTGIPGAGKTVLAGSAIQEAITRSSTVPDIGAGFYFCDYKNPVTQDPASILGAIASQLARQKNEAFDILQRYYDKLHPAGGLDKGLDADEVLAMVGEICDLFDQVVIVVDGLDECADQTDRVVEYLSDLSLNNPRISMALFSRHQENIRTRLQEDFYTVWIAANTDDLKLYVGAEMERRIREGRLELTSMDTKNNIIQTLVSKAQGMFRWVVCQLDYMCECADDTERQEALHRLPPNLDESYRRLLERVSRGSPRVHTIVKRCLHFIAYATPQLTISQLRQAVSTPDTLGACLDASNTVSEQEILRRCSSLIRKSENGESFEFAHFTVQEFLESSSLLQMPGLEIYSISKSKGQRLLGSQCLKFLQLSNFDRKPAGPLDEGELLSQRDHDFPFYKYAAVRWMQFTKDGLDDPSLLGPAKSLFDPSKTQSFSDWVFEIFRVLGETAFLRKSLRPLHLAAALNIPEICEFLLQNGTPVNIEYCSTTPLDLSIMTIYGMLNYVEEKWDNYDKEDMYMLPSAYRRNQTIDLLRGKGASHSNNSPYFGSISVFSMACIVGTMLSNLTPVVTLLTQGVIPNDADLDLFEKKLQQCDDSLADPVVELIRYMTSVSAYSSTWGFKLGSIAWNWAVGENISFTNDPLIIDSRISVSEEALVAKIVAAVDNNDFLVLRQCLADGRIDLSALYSVESARDVTLLHYAAWKGSYEVVEVLLESGCDPLIPDRYGDLPIHRCGSLAIIKKFVAHGVPLLTPNARGETVWHGRAKLLSSEVILNDLFDLYPEVAAEALLTKTKTGDTPLSLVLKADGTNPLYVSAALFFLDYCDRLAEFWQRHESVFAGAAKFCSERVIERLVELGAKKDPVQPDRSTPLHHLGVQASPKLAKMLKDMYPGACEVRWGGRLPVEMYIGRVLWSKDRLQRDISDVIQQLITPAVLTSMDTPGISLWEYCWSITNQVRPPNNLQSSPFHGWQHMDQVFNGLLRAGAMQVYEDQTKRPGMELVFSWLCHIDAWMMATRASISGSTLRQAIASTRYWDTAKVSAGAVKLLEIYVLEFRIEAVKALLENGVSVHQRVTGIAPIELVCQPEARRLHEDDIGKEIIVTLLEHTEPDKMNRLTPNGEGIGLLHRLAKVTTTPTVLWFVEELIKAGVDINGRAFMHNCTALLYHLDEKSFQIAELLLRMGADPLLIANPPLIADPLQIDGWDGYDAAKMATLRGGSSFLRQLLENSRSSGLSIPWDRTCALYPMFEGQRVPTLRVNSLHLAAAIGLIDCFKFYLDESLLVDINVMSAENLTPIHFAAMHGHSEMIEFLSSKGAKLQAAENFGRSTPLHLAVRNSQLSAVEALVKIGSPNSVDRLCNTPMMYAAKLGDSRIMNCLREAFGAHDSDDPAGLVQTSVFNKRVKQKWNSLDRAIQFGDLETCKRLYATGCPLNGSMPACRGCAPLVPALLGKRIEIAEWLMENGESVLKICSHPPARGLSVTEIAASSQDFKSILPQVLTKYLEEGGNWITGTEYPLHHAISGNNFEGVRLILQHLEENSLRIGQIAQVPPEGVFSTVLNRVDTRVTPYNIPLHLAVRQDSIPIVELLIGKGARIDCINKIGITPLAIARSDKMRLHLIQIGASVVPLVADPDSRQRPDILTRLLYTRSVDMATLQNSFTTYSIQLADLSTPVLARMGHDLTLDSSNEGSLMHSIICERKEAILVLNGEFGLERTSPFPWQYERYNFSLIAFTGPLFRHFKRRLGSDSLRHIMNLQPTRGWSPLCQGAARGSVKILENCLSMGAELDFEGCPWGSALMVASAAGMLESVKVLVRQGASVAYIGKRGPVDALSLARSKIVTDWLLVGRFTDQKRLAGAPSQVEELTAEPQTQKPWSGTAKARLRLSGVREMQPDESFINYAKRLAMIRKEMRGSVVLTTEGLIYL